MRKLRMSELNRLSAEEFKKAGKFPVVLVLDNVRSALNVGSVFRTADAFWVEGIFLCGVTPTPENREMRKTALGGTESVEWKYYKNTKEALQELKKSGFQIIAFEQTSLTVKLQDFQPESKVALIFGNEVKGVSTDVLQLCDKVVEIPQYGTKHSLNISVSAGIGLWEVINKIKSPAS